MFGVGFFEIVVIIVFALIFIGPKGLPDLMRKLGRIFVHVRRMSNDVKRQFDEVIRDAELEMEREKVEKLREMLQGKNFVTQKLQETVNIINEEGQTLPSKADPQKNLSTENPPNKSEGDHPTAENREKKEKINPEESTTAVETNSLYNMAAPPEMKSAELHSFEASSLIEGKNNDGNIKDG